MTATVEQLAGKCGLPEEAIASILRVIAAFPEIRSVTLFGSRAKGNFRPGSDIDLCLEAPDLTARDRLAVENELDDLLLPWNIDLLIHEDIDNPNLLAHIARVGICLVRR